MICRNKLIFSEDLKGKVDFLRRFIFLEDLKGTVDFLRRFKGKS
jgi:hypothetical protein